MSDPFLGLDSDCDEFEQVNIDDVMSNNDELAINMGVSSLDPRFMLLDGDNVPIKIEEEHMEELLAYLLR